MTGFHTFAVWWRPDGCIFYVDGRQTWRTNAVGVSQTPGFVLLSDEIGSWAGDIDKGRLPDEYLVDYVRVYDLVDVKGSGSPAEKHSETRRPAAGLLATPLSPDALMLSPQFR